MSSLLEQRYRRVLRLLPTAYRATWEEDMVATFLADAYAATPDDPEGVEIASPTTGELASIVMLAVRLRLGGVEAAPRDFLWGEAVRRVALVGLLAAAASAVAGVGFMTWVRLRLPFPFGFSPYDDAESTAMDQWRTLWSLSGLLWLPAYLSLVLGNRRGAKVLAGVALATHIIGNLMFLIRDGGPFGLSRGYGLLFDALPVLALVAFHDNAPPLRARPWLVALPVTTVALFAAWLFTLPALMRYALLDWPSLWCAGVSVAGVAALVAPATGRRACPPYWTLALAMLALAVSGLRAVTIRDYIAYSVDAGQATFVAVNTAEAVLALAMGVALTAYTVRHRDAMASAE